MKCGGRNIRRLSLSLNGCADRVEPLFAEGKAWHGLRRLRLRALPNANIQGLLVAAGQNLKRLLAAAGWGRRHAPCGSLLALPREPRRPAAVYR